MKIGLVIFPLFQYRGGLERVGVDVAHAMREQGHHVTIFYDAAENNFSDPTYPVHADIPLIGLELSHKTWFLFKARRRLLEADPDVLVLFSSSTWLLWFPLLLKGTGIPLLVSEHSHPDHSNETWNPYERMACLELADTLHLLHEDYKLCYPERLHAAITVIPNALSGAGRHEPPADAGERSHTILAAGRFDDSVKQFSLLMEAFAMLADRFPDWNLLLCGDGGDRELYEALAAKHQLHNRLSMPGIVSDMGPVYARSGIMCVPSRLETLSTVTIEAYSHGLPVVSFADCSGQRLLVRHGETGLLARDMTAAGLAQALENIMRDPDLRSAMGSSALEHSRRYAPDEVYPQWEAMLRATASAKGRSRILLACSDTENGISPQAKEILRREHPQDRRAYVRRHHTLCRRGETGPFSDAEIASFQKKHRRFGLAGPRALLRQIGKKLCRHA